MRKEGEDRKDIGSGVCIQLQPGMSVCYLSVCFSVLSDSVLVFGMMGYEFSVVLGCVFFRCCPV